MCAESRGDGSILAVGEMRPSKDKCMLLPSWCGENKECKISTKPRALQLHQHLLMKFSFWGSNYNKKKKNHVYIKDLLWR